MAPMTSMTSIPLHRPRLDRRRRHPEVFVRPDVRELAAQADLDDGQVVDGVVVYKHQFAPDGTGVRRPLLAAEFRPDVYGVGGTEKRQGIGESRKSGSGQPRIVFIQQVPFARSVVDGPLVNTLFEALKEFEDVPEMLTQRASFKFRKLLAVFVRLHLFEHEINLLDDSQYGLLYLHRTCA